MPIARCSAIHPTIIVVSARKRAAKATFTESPLEACGLSEIEGQDFAAACRPPAPPRGTLVPGKQTTSPLKDPSVIERITRDMDDPLNHDSPWKDTIDQFTRSFLEVTFPDVAAGIDWSVQPKSLEQELREITPASDIGAKRIDKLLNVRLLNGTDQWLFIHIEVQMQHDRDLPRRLFIYHYRIFDRYGVSPLTLAILGDASRTWRPTSYRHRHFGCGITFHFRICKTIDFKGKLDDPRHRHQQALFVIAAHLGTQQHRHNPAHLSAYRVDLTIQLTHEGYTDSEIHRLLRLIDWLMPLPDELRIQFRNQLQQRLPAKTMPHITLFEELALKEGLEKGLVEGRQEGIVQTAREAVLDVLDTRFGQVPASVRERVNSLCNEPTLKDLLRRAVRVSSLDEFQAAL